MTPGALAAALCIQAMNTGHRVDFDYDGKRRLVEVHAVGTSTKDGSLIMRGFLVGDDRPWRLFTLSKATTFGISAIHGDAPRDGYSRGDKQMATIFAEL